MINDLNVEDLRQKFSNAEPFPHVIIDNFLVPDVFKAISKEMSDYYSQNKDKGKTWNSQVESGKWGSTGLKLPPGLKSLDDFLKSQELFVLLEEISGFKDLKVTANINGVGFSFFHAMKPGAYLGPHTDHTRDLNGGPYHVLNIIIYMADNWDPNWGGGTAIYDSKIKLRTDIEYKPNRALVFMHSATSVHGTQKVSELAMTSRFSIYYDYYTNDPKPYSHLGLEDVKLIDSPHLFYFPTIWAYFKKGNRRYLKMHLSHLKKTLFGAFTK